MNSTEIPQVIDDIAKATNATVEYDDTKKNDKVFIVTKAGVGQFNLHLSARLVAEAEPEIMAWLVAGDANAYFNRRERRLLRELVKDI